MGERIPRTDEAGGSNPLCSTISRSLGADHTSLSLLHTVIIFYAKVFRFPHGPERPPDKAGV